MAPEASWRTSAWLILVLGLLAAPQTLSAADPKSKASDTPKKAVDTALAVRAPKPVEAPLPTVLGAADAKLYRNIFQAQDDGDWATANQLLATLEDRLLVGHVLAQRYLHSGFRAQYKDLRDWMAAYADHPDASRLYKLALERKPKGAKAPSPPSINVSRPAITLPDLEGAPEPMEAENDFESEVETEVAAQPRSSTAQGSAHRKLNRGERQEANAYEKKIEGFIRSGNNKAVTKLLESPDAKRLFGPLDYDRLRARLAQGYFSSGQDDLALPLASAAAKRSGARIPVSLWTAGLAAWRLKQYGEASRHFEALANQNAESPWIVSAAAFWAARSHLYNQKPEQYTRLLGVAAEHPRTFYGLLAGRMLGIKPTFRWDNPELDNAAIRALSQLKQGQRTLALLQIGQARLAERELTVLATGAQKDTAQAILAFASRAQLPSLAVRLDTLYFRSEGGHDGAAYPVPKWRPQDGFRVDRALIYALIRQESGFNPRAKSRAGAAGLMQLMPATASFVAGDPGFRKDKRIQLFTPELNMTLGQRYIEILLADENIKGDLFMLAAAWNGGPGNLNKWLRKGSHGNDPLLFIESVPSRETRIFIERVLTNLWIYRARMGQPAPSLDALAAGEWPIYTPLDWEDVVVAETGDAR